LLLACRVATSADTRVNFDPGRVNRSVYFVPVFHEKIGLPGFQIFGEDSVGGMVIVTPPTYLADRASLILVAHR
jgi:hypothetical protein